MALLTTTEVLEWAETDLSNTVLQVMLDDAEAEIIKRFGAHGESSSTITEDFYPDEPIYQPLSDWKSDRHHLIYPSRPVSAVTSITEREDDVETTLASNDYRLIHGGRGIERLTNGTNARNWWAPEVRIVYQAVSQLATRKRVQADLVKLAIQYKGLISEDAGDYSSSMDVYQTERNRILASLETGLILA